MSNCTNHEFYFMDNGCMPLRNKSMTLMRFCGFPHHGYRFFAGAQNDSFRSPSLWRFPFPITSDVLSPNRHSERWQACLVGKTGNGTVTRSEESITLMASYRFPHHGNRFFAAAQNDALPWVLLYRQARKWLESRLCRLFNVILNGSKNTIWKSRETGWWHRVKNLLP